MGKEKQYYYIYKISCPQTGQVYYGRHTSNSPKDPYYMGSGLWVKWARAKGLKLEKEILGYAPDFKVLCEMELELIKEKINDPDCVNVYTEHWEVSSRFKGWYHTPHGIFLSKREAESALGGVGASTVWARCVNCDEPIKPNRYLPKEYFGKTWRELGWYFVSKEELS